MTSLLEIIMRSKAIARKFNLAGSNGSDDFDPSASVVRHHHHLHHHHLDLSGRSQGFPPRPDQIEDPFATRHSQAEGSPPSNQDHPLLQNHSNHLQLQPPPPTLPVPGIESAAAAAGSAASMENLQLLQEWARRREPVCDLDIRESGVYAKTPLPRGTRYGPFPVNLCHQPNDMQLAWKAQAGHYNGWLEPTSEVSAWLKKIRVVQDEGISKANLQSYIDHGCLWYETNCHVSAGVEMVVDGRPHSPVQINESFVAGGGVLAAAAAAAAAAVAAASSSGVNSGGGGSSLAGDDRSDRDNGSLYSGDEFPKDKKIIQGDIDFTDDEHGFDIRCEVCDKVYPDLERLDDHLVGVHHFKQDDFPCKLCSQRFCYRPLLIKHEAISHNNIRKYSCENCTKVFCDPSNLQRHIRAYHVGARCHPCPECGKTFGTSSGLKQHQHIHSSVKPFACEVCSKAYTQFSNLCRHKRMHATCRMQIKCDKCSQSFSTLTSLTKHKKFCDSTGSYRQPLNRHHPHQQPLPHHQHPHTHPLAATATSSGTAGEPSGPGSGSVPGSSSSAAAAAVAAMSTPPNPFLMFRNGAPFFPGFPPYGLPGIFPQSPLRAANFPLFFPKPPLDMNMPTCQPFRQQLPFGLPGMEMHQGDPQTDIQLKDESMALKAEKKLKEEPMVHVSEGEEEDEESFDLKREVGHDKDEVKTEEQRKVKTEPERSDSPDQQQAEDDRKSIDIVSTPPPTDPTSGEDLDKPAADTPLDLSVCRKRYAGYYPEILQPENRLLSSNLMRFLPRTEEDDTEGEEPPMKMRKAHSSGESSTSQKSYKGSSPTPTASPGLTPSPSPPTSAGGELSSMSEGAVTAAAAAAAAAVAAAGAAEAALVARYQSNTAPQIHPLMLEEIYRNRYSFLCPTGGRPGIEALLQSAASKRPLPPVKFATGNPALKTKDRYTCKFCGKVFPRSANLTRHLRTHTGEQPYPCKYCDRAFSISSNLQRHVRNIHNKERPFRCELCDRSFGQQTNLDRHVKKHEAEGNNFRDSPSSGGMADREEYFEEIRTFMNHVYTPNSLIGAEGDTEEYPNSDDQSVSLEKDTSINLNNNNNSSNSSKSNPKAITISS
ncbi:uncharacterized protein Dana_GF14488, isoform C [Drosophila ananassae]|uniref:Uncharacterized protein, isoform C n=1 Tax=Drosophila ananassae TaxID=7217 RepID=A0A0P8ZFC9_DROAN|nr:transcription factor hamlet isoform X1 [Drosophila ananassae]KPU73471.1 uncharacterized protein Dana_GF14488, isoform C [Drosophila ananassae]